MKKESYVIGPQGQKRPASTTANAVRVMEIATGIREEEYIDSAQPVVDSENSND